MKPDLAVVLETTSQSLLLELGPRFGEPYGAATLGIQALLLQAVREELERAAARRVEENRALRRLFAGAGAAVADPELRARLEAAAQGEDASLLVSELEAGNRTLRALLVELHAHVETREGEAARRVEAGIWRELADSTERRRLSIAPF